ncbi:unnamed protein product [Sphenostylis stenocarpa]|uniref:Uncharacterized protein n=1 Tax=Sphenostylis stenocarpa TaxID=92480 RepID=A0AA86W6L5_9FABA|nr:unnamed protein product [Sphenostylis stenocarpa]
MSSACRVSWTHKSESGSITASSQRWTQAAQMTRLVPYKTRDVEASVNIRPNKPKLKQLIRQS